jgi:anti-repressor protein
MTNGILQQGLVYKSQKGTPVTDSLKVAQVFGKEHKNVIRAIRNMLVQAENSTAQNCAAKSWFMNQRCE